MTETGVIHGRFQVLHLKHMEYLLASQDEMQDFICRHYSSGYFGVSGDLTLDKHGRTKTTILLPILKGMR